MQTGGDLNDVPLATLYNIAYAEMYRQVELVAGMAGAEDIQKAFEQIDSAIRDATPDADTGLPQWVLRNMPVGADGTMYMTPDVSPPDEEPMPPPGAMPGKPLPEG
jgi:hypothetical protein